MKIEVETHDKVVMAVDPMDDVLLHFYTGFKHSDEKPNLFCHVLGPDDGDDYGLPWGLGPGSGNHRKWWSFHSDVSREDLEEKVRAFLGQMYAARLKKLNLLTRAVPEVQASLRQLQPMIHLGSST